MRAPVEVDFEVLQKVFDTAVNSMDFSSGFLDDEEVQALRACAVLLGVDPMNATPLNFECKYSGSHRWYVPFGETSEWRRGGTDVYISKNPDVMIRTCVPCRHEEQRPRTDEDRGLPPESADK